jgi:hypothetical protein
MSRKRKALISTDTGNCALKRSRHLSGAEILLEALTEDAVHPRFNDREEEFWRAKPIKALRSTQTLKKTLSLVKQLIRRKGGVFFETPVDPDALGIPDYWDIVDRPIDLSTIVRWIEIDGYDRSRIAAHEAIAEDVHRVFSNAMLYNAPDSEVYSSADQLNLYFEQQFAKICEEYSQSSEACSQSRSVGSGAKLFLSNTGLPQRILMDFLLVNLRGEPVAPEDCMQVGVKAAGYLHMAGAEHISNSAGTVSVKFKVEEIFHEYFPESDDAELRVWVRGSAAWYRLASPHRLYTSEWEPSIQRTRLGEQIKAFLDRNPKTTADKMLQAVAKKGGYDPATSRSQKGRERPPRGTEVDPSPSLSLSLYQGWRTLPNHRGDAAHPVWISMPAWISMPVCMAAAAAQPRRATAARSSSSLCAARRDGWRE